jgi:hypothetical protein
MFGWLETEFGLLIGFINHLQVVTTINYYTIAGLHNLQSPHANLLSLAAVVFNVFSLTESHTSNKAFNSHNKSSLADFSTITHYHWLSPTIKLIKPSNHPPSLHTKNFPWLSSTENSLKYSNPFWF